MASPPGPGLPSSPDPGSVLCDKCKKSVLEPSQNAENTNLGDRTRQALKDWLLSPRMWPVGYIFGSPYSPFRVEQELPARDWRNAFEDLLALESEGEMISQESRTQEKAVAAKLSWERANFCIETINKLNARDGPGFTLTKKAINIAKSRGNQADPSITAWLEKKMREGIQMAQRRVALAESFKIREAIRRDWSASGRKDYGQWTASLITSGALRGWSSTLSDSEDGAEINLTRESVAQEDKDGVTMTERELIEHFEDGKPLDKGGPGPAMFEISPPLPAVQVDDDQLFDENSSPQPLFSQPPPDERAYLSAVPDYPYFSYQKTAAERITLPNGKMATKVVIKNFLTDGNVEEKVIVQEPGKVLQEVEKARALISDRMLGIYNPI